MGLFLTPLSSSAECYAAGLRIPVLDFRLDATFVAQMNCNEAMFGRTCFTAWSLRATPRPSPTARMAGYCTVSVVLNTVVLAVRWILVRASFAVSVRF
jgi:hypothetical protein